MSKQCIVTAMGKVLKNKSVRLWWWNDYVKITLINFICVSTIILYGTMRCKGAFHDPLTNSAFPAPWNKFLDGWGISHFLYFALLGYLFPRASTLMFIFIMGVLWELVEVGFADKPFYVSKCNYHGTDPANDNWWYGRWQDIVMNTTGMFLGAYIKTRVL